MTAPDQRPLHCTESVLVPSEFSITVEPRRDGVRVAVHGELDLASVGHLSSELAELIAIGFARITIDLRSVDFIDSTGLSALLTAHAKAERDGWELSIIPGPPAVQRLFELTATVNELPFTKNGWSTKPGS